MSPCRSSAHRTCIPRGRHTRGAASCGATARPRSLAGFPLVFGAKSALRRPEEIDRDAVTRCLAAGYLVTGKRSFAPAIRTLAPYCGLRAAADLESRHAEPGLAALIFVGFARAGLPAGVESSA